MKKLLLQLDYFGLQALLKKISCLVICSLLLNLTFTSSLFAQCGTTNVAYDKTAVAKDYISASYQPKYAFDNNSTTRWASSSSIAHIRVDLGSIQPITCIKLDWAAAYASSYDILVSNDNVSYSVVWTTATGTGGVVDITGLNVSARHIKMQGKTEGHANQGYSINEFAIYGKANQTISFDAISTAQYGDTDITPTASSTSGLPISFASSNLNVATIVDSKIHIVGVGTSTITASNSGNGTYNAATNVTRLLTVNKGTQSINFNVLSPKMDTDNDFELTATASSNLPVSYTSSNPAVASVYQDINDNKWKVNLHSAGTTDITAVQAGNTNYQAATNVIQQLIVVEGVLPVGLVNFQVLPENNYVHVGWSTTSELGNKSFTISRSGDGSNFTQIGTIKGSETSFQLNDYQFNDFSPLPGTNYYKLDQIDMNGQVNHLAIKAIRLSFASNKLNIYPNPAKDFISVSFEPNTYSQLEVINSNGKILQSHQFQPTQSFKSITLLDYPAGIYILKFKKGNVVELRKIVKL